MKQIFCLLISITFISSCSRNGSLRVTRGEFNQPSITVERANDSKHADYQVFYQQGFEQASDRLLQMDVLRRMSQGRLSELIGPSAVEKDTLNIAVGLPYATDRSTEKLKSYPDLQHAMGAFADGVNQFILQMPVKRPDLTRIYREIARNKDYLPAAWVTKDSVAMGESMAFFLSTSLEEKLNFGIYGVLNYGFDFKSLPPKVAAQFDMRPIEPTYIVKKGRSAKAGHLLTLSQGNPVAHKAPVQKLPGKAAAILKLLPNTCLRLGFPWPDCQKSGPLGSNNWVVSQQYSGTGASFVANDPHLPLTFPTVFYEMALNSKAAGGTVQVAGLNVPGGPGIMIGHNEHMAWGFTNLGADVDDVYFEELSKDGLNVKFGEAWVPLIIEEVDLPVRLASGEVERRTVRLRWVNHEYAGENSHRTHRRPIFSDHHRVLGEALRQIEELTDITYGVSYRWVGHEGTTEMAAVYALNQSDTPEKIREAISLFGVGTQNVVYADRHGNIGFMAHGLFPIRRYISKDYPPYIPVVDHSDWDWDGYQSEVPHCENPEAGFIVSANNDPWGDMGNDFSQYLSYGFSTGIRAKRITTLLEENKGGLDLDAMKRIQFDHYDLLSQRFIDQLRKLQMDGLSAKAAEFARTLRRWNGESGRKGFEPVLWNNVLTNLMRRLFGAKQLKGRDELFDLERFIHSHPAVKTLFHRLNDGLKGRNPEMTAAKSLWSSALEDTATQALKDNLESRVWGEVSRMAFSSPLANILPSFAAFPIERDGTFDTVDVAHGAYGPSFRLIMRLTTEGISAINIMPGGNYSPTDTHRLYRELLMWRDGKYRDLVSY